MTLWQKIRTILIAVFLVLLGVFLIAAARFDYSVFADIEGLDPSLAELFRSGELNVLPYLIILLILSVVLLFSGIRMILFYFTMARHMNGGRSILYQGILFFDLGVLSMSLRAVPPTYIMAYLIGLLGFSGAVDVYRAWDARQIGGHWKLKLLRGTVTIAFAIYAFINLRTPTYCVYIFSATLFYNALMRIISVFRRSEIITIQ